MRGVSCTRCVVGEERLVGRNCFLILNPCDRLVGHVGQEIVIRVIWYIDLMRSIVDKGCPMVGFSAKETVEFVELLSSGPPNIEAPAKPRSSTKISNTLGAPDGALTLNRSGGVALRISRVFEGLRRGSASGKTVRSTGASDC